MKKTTAFRRLIHDPEILQLPICHDCLSRESDRAGRIQGHFRCRLWPSGELARYAGYCRTHRFRNDNSVQEHLRCCPYTGVCRRSSFFSTTVGRSPLNRQRGHRCPFLLERALRPSHSERHALRTLHAHYGVSGGVRRRDYRRHPAAPRKIGP